MKHYTLNDEQHSRWYSDDQRIHDALHDYLRRTLDPGTEIYDHDGVLADTLPGEQNGAHDDTEGTCPACRNHATHTAFRQRGKWYRECNSCLHYTVID